MGIGVIIQTQILMAAIKERNTILHFVYPTKVYRNNIQTRGWFSKITCFRVSEHPDGFLHELQINRITDDPILYVNDERITAKIYKNETNN